MVLWMPPNSPLSYPGDFHYLLGNFDKNSIFPAHTRILLFSHWAHQLAAKNLLSAVFLWHSAVNTLPHMITHPKWCQPSLGMALRPTAQWTQGLQDSRQPMKRQSQILPGSRLWGGWLGLLTWPQFLSSLKVSLPSQGDKPWPEASSGSTTWSPHLHTAPQPPGYHND